MPDLMNVFRAKNISELSEFLVEDKQLAIVERDTPKGAKTFFKTLMKNSFGVIGSVSKDNATADIRAILDDEISMTLSSDPFYEYWIADMAEVCKNFCDMQGEETVGFWLGSKRGCRRYHIDNVPFRALVTYAGKGTEWIPDQAADRAAFANGAPNEDIIKDPEARQHMNSWDVAVFRGGVNGLLHRTPDDALNDSSILMRLDHSSFWDNFTKQSSEGNVP